MIAPAACAVKHIGFRQGHTRWAHCQEERVATENERAARSGIAKPHQVRQLNWTDDAMTTSSARSRSKRELP